MSQTMEVPTSESATPKGVTYWFARVVVILVAAGWAVSHAFEGFMLLTGRFLWTGGGAEPGLPLDRLPILNQAELRPGTTGTMEDAELSLRLLNAVPLFLEALAVLVAAWLLLRVLRRVAAREAFSRTVIRQWRTLSMTLMIGGIAIGVLNTFTMLYTSAQVGLWPSSGAPDMDAQETFLGGDYSAVAVDLAYWPIPLIIAGLVALALTAALRAGAALERDVDGLI